MAPDIPHFKFSLDLEIMNEKTQAFVRNVFASIEDGVWCEKASNDAAAILINRNGIYCYHRDKILRVKVNGCEPPKLTNYSQFMMVKREASRVGNRREIREN